MRRQFRFKLALGIAPHLRRPARREWLTRLVFVLALGVVLISTAQIPAQTPASPEPPPPPSGTTTLSVNVRIVAVDAVVRDQQGNLVMNLGKDDFALRDDGKPVPIRYFNRDNDLPLTVGLLIDTSSSQRVFFGDEAIASDIFLRNTLTHPNDRAFVVRFDSQVRLLQKLTSNLVELHNALRLLDYQRDPLTGTHGATRLFDAIDAVSREVIGQDGDGGGSHGEEPGRRAVVIMTDGDDNGSQANIATAIRQAQMADVAVYSVLYTDESANYPNVPGLRPSGIEVMQQISRATGGRAFIVGAGTPIAQIFAAIAEDLRSQYRFGFTPPPSKPGKFHSLALKPVDKELSVQSRAGYYAPPASSAP
jgi:VWFA-related protein